MPGKRKNFTEYRVRLLNQENPGVPGQQGWDGLEGFCSWRIVNAEL
jgi:hypothetical protein